MTTVAQQLLEVMIQTPVYEPIRVSYPKGLSRRNWRVVHMRGNEYRAHPIPTSKYDPKECQLRGNR